MTVLFADIVGSSDLLSGMDPEDARGFLDKVMRTLAAAVERSGGTVVKFIGDGLFAVFGAPMAQEDHAFRACHASHEMQKIAAGMTAPDGTRVLLRIGLNSGTVAVFTKGDGADAVIDAFGDVVNRASHLEQEAAPGAVLLSAATLHLVGASIEARRHSPFQQQGSGEVFELVHCSVNRKIFTLAAEESRIPFVGRQREAAFLDAAFSELIEGRGDAIAVVGEAGTGKTRLISERLAAIAGDDIAIVAAANRAVDRTEPNSFLRRLVLALLEVDEFTSIGTTSFLFDRLSAVAPELADSADVLGWFLFSESTIGSPEESNERRSEALSAVMVLVQRFVRERPVVIAIDDFQWLDASSRAFVKSILPLAQSSPLLVLIASREDDPDLRGVAMQIMRLPPLSLDHARSLLEAILQESSMFRSLGHQEIDRLQGNPRFLVEVARRMRAAGEIDDSFGGQLGSPLLPESIADLFEERIDRLPKRARRLLQALAAYERALGVDGACAISGSDGETVRADLQLLQDAGLVIGSGAVLDPGFSSANPAVAEAAYRSLLRKDRAELHGRICDYLLRVPEHPGKLGMIGRHAYRSGRDEVAADAFYRAGRSALSRLAYSEGADLLREALRADARVTVRNEGADSLAIEIRLALREALYAASRFDEIHEMMREAEAIAVRASDSERLRTIRRHKVGNLLALGRLTDALLQARELVRANDRDGVAAEAAEARFLLVQILATLGQYRDASVVAREVLEAHLQASERARRETNVTYSLARMWALWCAAELGAFEDAKMLVVECQSVLGSDDPPFFRILAGIGTGLFWLRFGENELAADTLASVLPMTDLETTRAWFAAVGSPLGLALVRLGRAEEALPILEAAVSRSSGSAAASSHGMQDVHLAECLLALGDFERAETQTREAIARSERLHESGTRAYALRMLWLILDATGRQAEAAIALADAVTIAADLGMSPLLSDLRRN